ncbi:conserved Plasmodium protein, unknown function [Plasmodium berghei]|uniref:Uncharacterized protein n=2 Tax=Plasmodium berghei TaxID=5821 RepID=A0A509APK8_PLABA|nr:conserved Plasmodium protein, unknown function [Plasmodium berghei ANKA]CXI64757.1 conserved Plasmodium protein, unknown function [Plasmodium berghei]SCO61196.1 conserved Plasmodium protein, unknown function [Plasmodium berghei]VUC56658.1 conserved Plasmodium protein, unknown function [Plasmodium berghei ANKA]|eukprot:XP_034422444.1 conserved Plasmodium protein, unknown function [Plasmodium berghei ANKA]
MNEKCIETYIFKAKEMISLNLKKGRKAYEEICNMCIHMFYSKEECLNNSINLSWDKTVILAPALYIKRESSDGSKHEGIVINFPVTYILSKLLANLISLASYNKFDVEYISNTLQYLLTNELTNNLDDLPDNLGLFDAFIGLYMDALNDLFIQMSKNNTNKEILDNYIYFEGYLDQIKIINHRLLYLSKQQYWGKKQKRILPIFSKINLYRDMDNNIKKIYKFIYTNYSIVEGIRSIYNDEKKILYIKEEEDLRLYYIRNESLIKNHCSVYIVTAISWFLNQVNLNMYDNNKDILTTFRDKFSSENINKILKSIYTYKDFYEKNVINTCMESMESIIKIVDSTILAYTNNEVVLLKKNLTFSNLIRSMEIILLQSKINSINKEEDRLDDDVGSDIEIAHELRQHEHLICLMKYISKEMEFYILSLKPDYFKNFIKENYNNFKTNVNYTPNETELYFCTFPGKFFVHRLFINDILHLINMRIL